MTLRWSSPAAAARCGCRRASVAGSPRNQTLFASQRRERPQSMPCCYNGAVKKLVLAILLVASGLQAAPSQTRTVLVLPFENESANSDLGWISEAFAEVLSVRLAGPGRYVLDRDQRNAAYE